ncbi:MAG TPA: 7TM diverse intracellular signaling domain-containing protein [Burkholderiaceae bacterium]|nr:7TM diverse intracellular signaling domain-containing protein [Burkholderiaceae bacterium]
MLLSAVLALCLMAPAAQAADVTRQAYAAMDASGTLGIAQVDAGALALEPLEPRSFALGSGALWVRLQLAPLDPAKTWYLRLSGSTVVDRATLFTRDAAGRWQEQRAGDHIPVAQWAHPAPTPLFTVPATGGTAWLRVQNHPAPVSPFLQLMDQGELQRAQSWSFLGIGMYLGFGLLVLIVGLIHGHLYRERVFHSYCAYVFAMLMFQLAYTGMGGLFLWPQWARWNDTAPALFMFAMVAAGIWNIREGVALQRHSRALDRFTLGFSAAGVLFGLTYSLLLSRPAFALLNLYGLASVVLSIGLCLWTWRRGERYSGWLFLGFLPVHLAYPFPALRAAGVIGDSWATQYALLIGSAIEIPLLLYILHARAKDFSENRARLRAEGPQPADGRVALAQHIVARGLEPVRGTDAGLPLEFRVVTAWLPDVAAPAASRQGGLDEQGVLERLGAALDQLGREPRRVLLHLEAPAG